MRNSLKTGEVCGTPPEDIASFSATWRRAVAPYALLTYFRCFCFASALGLAVSPFSLTAAQRGGSSSLVSRTIEGTVLDHSGAAVPGAVVLIKDLKSLQVRSYIAQQDGKYHFHGLSSDVNYQLRAQFNGLASGPKTVSVFESHPTVVLNLKLRVKPK